MKEKVTLGQVLDHLRELGEGLAEDKPLVDLKGIIPQNDHHQTAVFLRLPYPGALQNPKVNDRVMKLLTSINRPDTIKADLYTLLGENCMKGYQPTIGWVDGKDGEKVVGGLFNPDWVIPESENYVLQITVDIVLPDVLNKAMGNPEALKKMKTMKSSSSEPMVIEDPDEACAEDEEEDASGF